MTFRQGDFLYFCVWDDLDDGHSRTNWFFSKNARLSEEEIVRLVAAYREDFNPKEQSPETREDLLSEVQWLTGANFRFFQFSASGIHTAKEEASEHYLAELKAALDLAEAAKEGQGGN